jgi:hypothetical protein
LGGCLANIGDISKSLATMIGIQMVMDDCVKVMSDAESKVESSLAEQRNIFVPLDVLKKLMDHIDIEH